MECEFGAAGYFYDDERQRRVKRGRAGKSKMVMEAFRLGRI